MPLRLEIKKKLSARSERVKCVDFHPTEPWVLAALYTGHVYIWNYVSQSMVKSVEVSDLPVRAAKFVPSKQWIVTGSDDLTIRVYNYNTMERLCKFEAHTDYIRSIAVHPTLPLILSSSDDMLIKAWDWEKNNFDCVQVFEGHTHYVMQVEFNPKDPNTFASASLDRTIKVWGLTSSSPYYSLEGHERGVNAISYYRGGDRPYLLSGADDHTVKIWDYQTKACLATLEGHTANVCAVAYHPELPIILSGSEDGTVRVWHSNTYRLENTLNYGMERVWTIACLRGTNKVAIGYDEGTIMIKLGHEEAVASMERGGKVVYANNHDMVIVNLRSGTAPPSDGERLSVSAKDLGACELYPQSVSHDPKGRLLCVSGDGEYIIYTALALKNKSFGSALEFVWAAESGVYCIRESISKIKVFKDFKEYKSFRPAFAAEAIFGGQLLGVRGSDFIDFYEWTELKIVRRIDVLPKKVYWSESGEVVILACESSFYVLRYNGDLVQKCIDNGVESGEQGIEHSFDLEKEVSERVRHGSFVGDCFIYVNNAHRLNYYVGGEVITLAHLPKPMLLLGYLPKENRVYLMDKAHNIVSYQLLLALLIYQTAIVRHDFEGAKKSLAAVPEDQHNRLARFLESQDLKELALEISKDPDHRFDMALACKKLEIAREVARTHPSEQKWKQLGDLALEQTFDLQLSEECYRNSQDLSALLLLYTSKGDAKGLSELVDMARKASKFNIAFLCLFLLNRIDEAVQLLIDTGRIAEAAFLCRTYAPSGISKILALWKDNLRNVSATAADALADPEQFPNQFPDLQYAQNVETWLRATTKELLPARTYGEGGVEDNLTRNLIQELKDGNIVINNSVSPKYAQPSKKIVEPTIKSPFVETTSAASSPLNRTTSASASPTNLKIASPNNNNNTSAVNNGISISSPANVSAAASPTANANAPITTSNAYDLDDPDMDEEPSFSDESDHDEDDHEIDNNGNRKANSNIPSLDDINNSLAELDDEFKDF